MLLALIPAKPFTEAKTRLSPLLTPMMRRHLSYMLFTRTLHLLKDVAAIERVLVVSRSAEVLNLAQSLEATALPEQASGLNLALQQGATWASQNHYSRLLILPLDLPYLSASSVRQVIQRSQHHAVVITPCQRGEGTNALLMSPPNALRPQFGPNSFRRHWQAAQQNQLNPAVYHAPDLAFDLDTPEDWHTWAYNFCPVMTYE